MTDESLIIADPIKWQETTDNHPLSLNLRGSRRFWLTVESLLDRPIIRSSAPELSGMVIHLKDDVWLELKTTEGSNWLDYRFVSQADVEKDHAWAFKD
jgi:hypothetical protein